MWGGVKTNTVLEWPHEENDYREKKKKEELKIKKQRVRNKQQSE